MKKSTLLISINLILIALTLTGCRRSPGEVWEDSKSASRYMGRGVKAMGGKHGDSRQVQNRDEFYAVDDGGSQAFFNQQSDFVSLQDENGNDLIAMGDGVPQPRETPGEPGSSIPGIEAFQDPSTNPQLAGIFKNIHFELNSNLIKGQENLDTMRNISEYLRQHPNAYIFVEGHADERGPDAYNFALGSKRSNAVRNMLVKEGVSADNVFTISYGKERPLVFGHDEESWGLNRRAEFKIYQK